MGGLIWILIVGVLVFLIPTQNSGNKITGFVISQEMISSYPELFSYDEEKNRNLLNALEMISYEFNQKDITVTQELLAAIIATLRMEVGAKFLPVSEYSYASCPKYTGGCDYKGRGWIQITHSYNYENHCGSDCLLGPGQTCVYAHESGGRHENDIVASGELEEYILTCPPAKALLPEYAAKIFVSFYVTNDLDSKAKQKDFYNVGLIINAGTDYATNFESIAWNELNNLRANQDKTTSLLNYLNTYQPEEEPEEEPTTGIQTTPLELLEGAQAVYSIIPSFEIKVDNNLSFYQKMVQDAKKLLDDVEVCKKLIGYPGEPVNLYQCVWTNLPSGWLINSNVDDFFAFNVSIGKYLPFYDEENSETQIKEVVYKFALYIPDDVEPKENCSEYSTFSQYECARGENRLGDPCSPHYDINDNYDACNDCPVPCTFDIYYGKEWLINMNPCGCGS